MRKHCIHLEVLTETFGKEQMSTWQIEAEHRQEAGPYRRVQWAGYREEEGLACWLTLQYSTQTTVCAVA
jgi:hypothetical protein